MSFGLAAAVVVAGAVCGFLIGGATADVLAIGLVTLGLGAALLLAFLEVGLSEDRDRAEEEERKRRQPPRPTHSERRSRLRRPPRRPG